MWKIINNDGSPVKKIHWKTIDYNGTITKTIDIPLCPKIYHCYGLVPTFVTQQFVKYMIVHLLFLCIPFSHNSPLCNRVEETIRNHGRANWHLKATFKVLQSVPFTFMRHQKEAFKKDHTRPMLRFGLWILKLNQHGKNRVGSMLIQFQSPKLKIGRVFSESGCPLSLGAIPVNFFVCVNFGESVF